MVGSLIIFGGNKNSREEKILNIVNKEEGKTFEKLKDLYGRPDIFIISLEDKDKSIGITQTREGVKFLRERPFSYKKKFLIILDSEKLTTQAQNSLLKTLEEPPSYALIILSSKTQNSLLETIVSRCRVISVKENEKQDRPESDTSLTKILKMTMGERLDICLEMSKEEKEDVLEILERWVEQGREVLLKDSKNPNNVKNIKRIMEIKKDLENTNVNVRVSLEALVLSLF